MESVKAEEKKLSVNEKKLIDMGMKTVVYHDSLRNRNKTFRFTVCMLVDSVGLVVAHGIATCSRKDQFIKKVGVAKATGRAISALEQMKNVVGGTYCLDNPNFTLNEYEQRMVKCLWVSMGLADKDGHPLDKSGNRIS